MSTRVCLSTANTLSYPQGGGYLWVFINWALGFRACGCDVYWLDVVRPDIQPEELRGAVQHLRESLKPFGLDGSILVDCLSDQGDGRDILTTADVDNFDLLFDLRYNLPERLRKRAKRSALLDIDPGQFQVALSGGGYPDPQHDLFFTI